MAETPSMWSASRQTDVELQSRSTSPKRVCLGEQQCLLRSSTCSFSQRECLLRSSTCSFSQQADHLCDVLPVTRFHNYITSELTKAVILVFVAGVLSDADAAFANADRRH